jgi:hypothetical protein
MKTLAVALALALIAVPAHAMSVSITADPTNASWCQKPDEKSHWTLEFVPGHVYMWTNTEIKEKHDIPVAADGSFDKTIEMLSANTFSSHLRVWGNVNTREFNTHNVRRFCKYHGTW